MSRDTDKLISSFQDEISEFESKIEELEKENKKLDEENDSLKNQIDEINILATDFENDAKYWRNKCDELNKNNNYTLY